MKVAKEIFEMVVIGIILYIGWLALMYVGEGQGYTLIIRFIMMSILFSVVGFKLATSFIKQS